MDALAEALRAAGVRVHVFADEDHTRPTACSPTTGSPPTPAARSRSTRCTPPTGATNVVRTCSSCSSRSTASRRSSTTPASSPTASSSRAPARWSSTTSRGSPTPRAATGPTPTCSSASARTSATSRWPSTRSTPMACRSTTPTSSGCVGTEVALFALDMIPDQQRRDQVRERLSVNGRTVVELTEDQVRQFAGNAVELCGRTPEGRRATSWRCRPARVRSLRPDQSPRSRSPARSWRSTSRPSSSPAAPCAA